MTQPDHAVRSTRTPPHPIVRRQRRGRSDRGSVTVELAVLFPLFLIVVLTGVQAAVWWHARSVALAAATAGVNAARVLGGTDADGRRAATEVATQAGDGVLTNPQIDAGGDQARVRVAVTGTAPRVLPIPGLDFDVSQIATAPRERATTP